MHKVQEGGRLWNYGASKVLPWWARSPKVLSTWTRTKLLSLAKWIPGVKPWSVRRRAPIFLSWRPGAGLACVASVSLDFAGHLKYFFAQPKAKTCIKRGETPRKRLIRRLWSLACIIFSLETWSFKQLFKSRWEPVELKATRIQNVSCVFLSCNTFNKWY